MSDQEKIRTAFARQTRAVNLRSGVGKGTAVTTARVRHGLTVDVEEGDARIVVDASPKWGGNGEGPNPGFFGRAALASCLAQGYMMWASRREVPIEGLTVAIHADYDTRGMCAVDDVGPAYGEVRVEVTLESSAPEEDIRAVLDEAERHSPYFSIFRNGLPIRRSTVRIGSGA